MPSAASAKVEKAADFMESFKQAIVVVEHKIRNLEKRKVSFSPCLLLSLCLLDLSKLLLDIVLVELCILMDWIWRIGCF